jgi:hypothetical protein
LQEESSRHGEAVDAYQTLRNDVAAVQVANEGARETLTRCVCSAVCPHVGKVAGFRYYWSMHFP